MKEILFIVVKIGCEFVSLSSFNSQAHWWKKEEKNKNKNKMTIQIVSYKFIHLDNYPINSTSISIFSIQAGRSNFRLEVSPLVANGILKNGLSLGSEFRHSQRLEKRIKFVAEAPFWKLNNVELQKSNVNLLVHLVFLPLHPLLLKGPLSSHLGMPRILICNL